MCQLSRAQAEEFYGVHRGKPFFEKLVGFMSSGRIAALELVAPGAVGKWRELIGPTDSNRARAEAPSSIRAHFGTDG
jgi:nucleoside diphosphate kinase